MTHVYIARQEERKRLVKIGMTDDLDQRIYQLQCEQGNPLSLLGSSAFMLRSTARRVEKGLHTYFEHSRHFGEWFFATEGLLTVAREPLFRFAAVKTLPRVQISLSVTRKLQKALKLRAIEDGLTIAQLADHLLSKGLGQ